MGSPGITQMKETIRALEVKVEGLQKSILELKQQQEESRQSVLVYGLDDIVCSQVMGPNFPPASLADIQAYVNDGFVSAEGRRKWVKFVNILEEQGLSVQKVVTASKLLRAGSREDEFIRRYHHVAAHQSKQERSRNVTHFERLNQDESSMRT